MFKDYRRKAHLLKAQSKVETAITKAIMGWEDLIKEVESSAYPNQQVKDVMLEISKFYFKPYVAYLRKLGEEYKTTDRKRNPLTSDLGKEVHTQLEFHTKMGAWKNTDLLTINTMLTGRRSPTVRGREHPELAGQNVTIKELKVNGQSLEHRFNDAYINCNDVDTTLTELEKYLPERPSDKVSSVVHRA